MKISVLGSGSKGNCTLLETDSTKILIDCGFSAKETIKRLAEVAGERGYDLDKQLIGICHGDDIEAANQLKQYMTDMYGCKDFFINQIGATIGSHSGPGTLAVFFLSK